MNAIENQMVFQRRELKYRITRMQREALLCAVRDHMEPDVHGHSSVRNLYYDTPSFLLIRQSLEGPIYKEKLRIRSYGRCADEDFVFLELKKKYDSVVFKRRILLPYRCASEGIAGLTPLPPSQIGNEIRAACNRWQNLAPRVFLSYERDAFFSGDGTDFRVTFDEDIRYRTQMLTLDSECWGEPLLEPHTVLMELKTASAIPLWMVHELSRLGICKTTFSKYGAAYRQMQRHNQKGAIQYAERYLRRAL